MTHQPYRCEPFAQDVAYVVENCPSLTDHVERRLARMYDISATDGDARQPPRAATHVKMFPGAIVCSLLRRDIPQLVDTRNNYVVLEKTDGVRYLLLLTTLGQTPYAVLIDRKMQMRIVNLDMPLLLYEQEVLFDGELAQNVDNGLFTYLIFDLIYTGAPNDQNERLRRDTPYTYRMRRANELIRGQWNKQLTTEAEYNAYGGSNTGEPVARPRNTFAVKVKRYVPIGDFERTFADVQQRNVWTYHGFRIDGFIFVRSRQSVEPFRNARQYKYKPAERHTVDLQLLRTPAANESYELLVKNARNCPQRLALLSTHCRRNVEFLTQHAALIEQCHASRTNLIVECSWDVALRCWVLQEPRLDKQTPNALHTVEQTKCNIDENITLDELMQAFCHSGRHSSAKEVPATTAATSATVRTTTTAPATTAVVVTTAAATSTRTATTAASATTARTVPIAVPQSQPLRKGPTIHPTRLRNFQPMSAGEHLLHWSYARERCDDGCQCTFCTGKRADALLEQECDGATEPYQTVESSGAKEPSGAAEPYDPETAVRCRLTTGGDSVPAFSDADLENLLLQARDPAVLKAIQTAL